MIAYVTFGTDDIDRARRFYRAFLPNLGYDLTDEPDGLSCRPVANTAQSAALPDLYIKRPFDGAPASAGNGTMVAFEVQNQAQVRMLHAAALSAGGMNDGSPGFRDAYSANFYVGYLRDPQGNKIALYASNPDDPTRDS